jgi:hypothetical protein
LISNAEIDITNRLDGIDSTISNLTNELSSIIDDVTSMLSETAGYVEDITDMLSTFDSSMIAWDQSVDQLLSDSEYIIDQSVNLWEGDFQLFLQQKDLDLSSLISMYLQDGTVTIPINFTDLLDTQNTYAGEGGKILKVSSDETGIVFETLSSIPLSIVDLTDVPDALVANKYLKINSDATAIEFVDVTAGVTTITGLTDVPDTLVANKYLKVNSDATSIEFVDVTTGASSFIGLTDVPASFSGNAGKFLKVNSGATAIEFGTGIESTSMGDTTSVYVWKLVYNTSLSDTTLASATTTIPTNSMVRIEVAGRCTQNDLESLRVRYNTDSSTTYKRSNIYNSTGSAGIFNVNDSETYHPLLIGTGGGGGWMEMNLKKTSGANRCGFITSSFKSSSSASWMGLILHAEYKNSTSDITSITLSFAGRVTCEVNLYVWTKLSDIITSIMIDNTDVGGSTTFLGLTDTPDSFTANKYLKVNSGGTAIEFVDVTGGTGSSTITGLTDVPDTLVANKYLKVNSDATAIEFVDVTTGSASFLGLTDTPDSYTNQNNKFVKVHDTSVTFDKIDFTDFRNDYTTYVGKAVVVDVDGKLTFDDITAQTPIVTDDSTFGEGVWGWELIKDVYYFDYTQLNWDWNSRCINVEQTDRIRVEFDVFRETKIQNNHDYPGNTPFAVLNLRFNYWNGEDRFAPWIETFDSYDILGHAR